MEKLEIAKELLLNTLIKRLDENEIHNFLTILIEEISIKLNNFNKSGNYLVYIALFNGVKNYFEEVSEIGKKVFFEENKEAVSIIEEHLKNSKEKENGNVH